MAAHSRPSDRDRKEMIALDEAFRQLKKLIAAEWDKESINGLGVTQARILIILSESGPLKASALAEMLFVTSGAVTGLADQLIEMELIRRERSQSDRRIVLLSITPAGQELVEAIHNKRIGIMERLVRDLDEAEVDELTRLIRKMVTSPR
ncbi:MarR family transcriptional regulator [Paenibacillus sp. 598K]|uniref:MarR family winged helix-turn-helix transcriptional regulator n=1 Tax=Paenibacillus sp. 598K TaxID=1117987 RepID=UPI000FF9C89B|nr:MarR family transcriptional regulator [Paenibacillus sp. 598K]GBF76624.1 MarR family transcriptional regulator [Paenibacillus sp. 598K]